MGGSGTFAQVVFQRQRIPAGIVSHRKRYFEYHLPVVDLYVHPGATFHRHVVNAPFHRRSRGCLDRDGVVDLVAGAHDQIGQERRVDYRFHCTGRENWFTRLLRPGVSKTVRFDRFYFATATRRSSFLFAALRVKRDVWRTNTGRSNRRESIRKWDSETRELTTDKTRSYIIGEYSRKIRFTVYFEFVIRKKRTCTRARYF